MKISAIHSLALVISAMVISGGEAFASAKFDHAIHYYKTKHYVQAAELFEDLLQGEYAASADAHYYYANCLLKTSRRPEALSEYRRVIQLKPDSLIAQYSKRVLELCSGGGSDYLGRSESARNGDSSSLGDRLVRSSTSRSGPSSVRLKLKEKDAIAAEIKAKLPELPELVTGYKEGASLKEFMSSGTRNVFYCRQYWLKAKAAAEQAKENLKKVILATSGLVPSQRLRGESEDGLRARQDHYRDEINKILKPYAQNLMDTEEWLKEKTAVMNADTNASN